MKNHLLDQIIPDTEAVDKVADAAEVTDPLAALIALLQRTPPNTVVLTAKEYDEIIARCAKRMIDYLKAEAAEKGFGEGLTHEHAPPEGSRNSVYENGRATCRGHGKLRVRNSGSGTSRSDEQNLCRCGEVDAESRGRRQFGKPDKNAKRPWSHQKAYRALRPRCAGCRVLASASYRLSRMFRSSLPSWSWIPTQKMPSRMR